MSAARPRIPGEQSAALPVAAANDRGDRPMRDDTALLAALRTGDEAAFTLLVERYHTVMVRLARAYVRDTGLAEEVAQDAWLSILRGLDGFEGRSSLKTWIFRIVINRALARAGREQRVIPFSDAGGPLIEDEGPAVEPGRFRGPDDPYHGGWVSFPRAGAPHLNSAYCPVRCYGSSRRRLTSSRPGSAKSSCCAMFRIGTPRRCATLSSFQKPISAFCCTGVAQNCGAHWRTISLESEQSENGLSSWHYLPGISGVGD